MLRKLLKYDFLTTGKTLLPIYLAMLIITFIFSVMVRINIYDGLIGFLVTSLFTVALLGSMFTTILFTVNRFNNGLLKNEGYLSFALPVKTSTHIIAKVLNALIWGVMELIALCLAFLIMGLIVGSVKDVAQFFSEILRVFGMIEKEFLLSFFKVLIIISLEVVSSICMIYCGLAIGHLFDKHQKLIFVLYLVIISVIRSTFMTNLLGVNEIVWYIMPIITICIYSFITWIILDRRLNLE